MVQHDSMTFLHLAYLRRAFLRLQIYVSTTFLCVAFLHIRKVLPRRLSTFVSANLDITKYSMLQIFVCKYSFEKLRPRIFVRKSSSTHLRPQSIICKTTNIRTYTKVPKGSKARVLARRRAVCCSLDRLHATRHHRTGGNGDRRRHAVGDGTGMTGDE